MAWLVFGALAIGAFGMWFIGSLWRLHRLDQRLRRLSRDDMHGHLDLIDEFIGRKIPKAQGG